MDASSRQIEPVLNPIGGFAFSPDGKLIALVGLGSVPEGDGTLSQLAFLDVATGRVLHRAELGPRARLLPHLLAFAPDGKTVATLDNDGLLRFWDAASAKLLSQERVRRRGSGPAIAFSPRTQPALLAISDGKVIHIRDTVKNRNVSEITVEGKQPATGLAFSPDGAILAAAINIPGAEVRFWRARDGSPVRRFKSEKKTSLFRVYFSPDGKLLAATGGSAPPVLFDARNGKELGALGMGFELATAMAFSPDGRTLVADGGRQAIHFWDTATGKDRLATPEAHLGNVGALAFSPDGKTLISGSDDRTVRFWDLATARSDQNPD